MLLTWETLASLKWSFCARAPLAGFPSPSLMQIVLCYLGLLLSSHVSDPWAGTRSHALLLLLWGCLLDNALGCPSSHLTRCQGPLGSEEWDNKKHWSLGKQS